MPPLLTFTNVIFLFDVAVKGNTSHKKSVLQKAFQEFGAVLSSACNFTKKCKPSYVFFMDFDPTGKEQLFCTLRSTSMATFGKIYTPL